MSPSFGGWLLRDLAIVLFIVTAIWLASLAPASIASLLVNLLSFVGAYAVCYIAHEWGHWIGGQLAGADQPFLAYNTPLMTAFDISAHTPIQFVAMSWGGVAGYFSAAVAMLTLYALGWAAGGLAVGALAFVVQSLAVDVPQVLKVQSGADPARTNREGAAPSVILARTWQTWIPLAGAIIAWHVLR